MTAENLGRAPEGTNSRLLSYVGIKYNERGERLIIRKEEGEACGGICVEIGYAKYNQPQPVFPEILVSLHIRSDDSLGLQPVVRGNNFETAKDSERIEAGVDFIISRIQELGLDKNKA